MSLIKSECLVSQTRWSGFDSSNFAVSFVKFQNHLFNPPSRRHQRTFSSDRLLWHQRPVKSVATGERWCQLHPSLLRTTTAMGNTDIIIVCCYCAHLKIKCCASSLNRRACLLECMSATPYIPVIVFGIPHSSPFSGEVQWLSSRTSISMPTAMTTTTEESMAMLKKCDIPPLSKGGQS
jgi:hypothetical protein